MLVGDVIGNQQDKEIKGMSEKDKFELIHDSYNKQLDIKASIEQKAGLLLTAIGIYFSVFFLNVFSNYKVTANNNVSIIGVEFIHDFNFINFCISLIIISFYLYKGVAISKEIILKISCLIYIFSPSVYIFLRLTGVNIIKLDNYISLKAILFYLIILKLLTALYFLFKCIDNQLYKLRFTKNYDGLLDMISDYTYAQAIEYYLESADENAKINKNKGLNYQKSLELFINSIVLTVIYLII